MTGPSRELRTGAPGARRTELLGWLTALVVSIAVVAVLYAGPRSDVLFRDGDAVLPILIAHSLAAGQAQDWAMSSVLFLPELAVTLPLSLLGLPSDVTLALAGVVWFMLLYAALRTVAGATAGAVLAHLAFCIVALTETSPDRDALDLASPLAASTYYAATVIACVVTVAVFVRSAPRRPIALIALGALSFVSCLSNPLYAVWGILPILLVGILVLRRAAIVPAVAIVGAAGAAMASRMLLSHTIVNDGFGYIQPAKLLESAQTYARALGARFTEPGGIAGFVIGGALIVAAAVIAAHTTSTRRRFVALMASAGPVIVVAALIVMGSDAPRYLQPAVFYPVLALTLVRVPRGTGQTRALIALVLLGALAAGWAVTAAVRGSAARTDADQACVLAYAERSAMIGGGQYWTIRPLKAQLRDPRRLVQIDHQLAGYEWLTNREDYRGTNLGYVVIEPGNADDSVFAPLDPGLLSEGREVPCGRYTVVELREPVPITGLRYSPLPG